MFRITHGDEGVDVDSIDRALELLRREEAGRYRVDEIRAQPFPSATPRGLAAI